MRFGFILLSLYVALATGSAAEQPVSVVSRSWESAPAFNLGDRGPVAAVAPLTPDSLGGFQTAEDGTRFLTVRFSLAGAAATRLHLTDMHLPTGARVFVYGLDGGQVTDVAGPYTASGDIDASLWTGAVRGSEIVLELQEGNDAIADLPFTVAEVAATSASEAGTPATASAGAVRTSMFRGMPVTHEVVDGLGVFERDIILGEAADLPPASGGKGVSRSAVAITGASYRWPGGIIPYSIDPTMPNTARITDAITHWNTVMAGVVKLVPRTTESAYLYFYHSTNAGQCASSVGRLGYGQYLYVGDYCSTGNMIHEIGHAFGLWHEQSREDRNTYVKINWANIDSTMTYNFNQNITDGDDINAYDYGSVMHYNGYAFSVNGLPSIETIPAGIPIGQRNGLSAGDIAGIKTLYPPTTTTTTTTPTPVAVTVSANIAGIPVIVDGASYTTSTTFNWLPGSTHTVSAPTPYTTTSGRYTFQNWSDAGGALHIYITPKAAAALKATYAVAYPVSTTVAGVGTAAVTPAAADGYYSAQSTVTVQATPATGYCFTGWTGLLAGTPASTTLTVSQAYKLTAGFQTGSVNVSPNSLLPSGNGGSYVVSVTANAGCAWTFQSPVSWIRLRSTAPTSGSAVLSVTADPNTTPMIRQAAIKIGPATLYIMQGPKH